MADIKITVDTREVARAKKDVDSLSTANNNLAKQLDPLIKREREFRRTLLQVNDAVRLGVINQRRANVALKDLGKQYGYTTQQVQRMNLALVQNTRSFKRFGSVGLQQVGYQVGDFAVQLQGGTNAFVAFGQQGSQLLGIFGPMGAIAGAVLAIFTAFAAPLSKMETGTGAAAAEMAKLKGELEPIATMVSNLASSLKGLAIGSINSIANNLQKVVSYATAFAALWLGRLGIVYGIKAATWAMSTFGSVGAAAFALIKRAMITTGFLALGVLLGEITNKMLQVREATGSWGKTFKLVGDLVGAVLKDAYALLDNIGIGIEQAGYNIKASWYDTLAGMSDGTHNLLNETLAGFKIMWKGVSNAGKTALNGVLESFNNLLASIYSGIDNLFAKIASLPGAAQLGITGTNLSASGYKADLLPVDLTSNDSIRASVIADRGATSMAGERLRGSANGLRKQAEAMEKFKNETGATRAAWDALSAAWKRADSSRQRFDLEALMKAMQGVKEATGEDEAGALGISGPSVRGGTPATRTEEDFMRNYHALRQYSLGMKELDSLSKDLSTSFVNMFRSITDGTKGAKEAFKDMAQDVIKRILDILIWQPMISSLTNSISSAFGVPGMALAGATKGGVIPFANGGVVNSPTYFGMSGGRTGLMGEAGPEAIMPLKRGPNGKLGVEGGGNVTVHQSFNFSANGDESVKKIIAQAAPSIAKMTEAQIVNSRQRGGQMRRVFS